MALNKVGNEYAEALGRKAYEKTPKAVYAAIAYSLALRLCGDNHEDAIKMIGDEWLALNEANIVKQIPYKDALA